MPWRDELVRVAGRLETKTKQARWTNRTDYLIERDFVVGAYAMRWLLESGQVSDDALHRIPVRRFDSGAMRPIAPGDLTVSYDFEGSRRDELSVADLCHQILRNVALTFYAGETADLFDGVFVGSDDYSADVYLVLASDFIALCEDVANSTTTQSI